ncbi:MAG: lysophospholipid acyltransferase family protein [Hyphomicrobiaceae bacterium]|nr:lysophospholipid acyltransferase family protein [Hyphomicrobiaceae bacterium]
MTWAGEAAGIAPVRLAPFSRSLPYASFTDALLLRAIATWSERRVLGIYGLDRILPAHDPFILALNHSTRLEAILVPALLMHLRGGRHIHFMADWNFRLIPGVGFLYRRARVITVARKPARPRLLNVLRPLLTDAVSPLEAARSHLLQGRPLGVFPEGTVNRDPERLLRGRYGIARLALETGVPVIPAGLRFPGVRPGGPVGEGAPFELHIGEPIASQGDAAPVATGARMRALHGRVMRSIGHLSGKTWSGHSEEETSHDDLIAH